MTRVVLELQSKITRGAIGYGFIFQIGSWVFYIKYIMRKNLNARGPWGKWDSQLSFRRSLSKYVHEWGCFEVLIFNAFGSIGMKQMYEMKNLVAVNELRIPNLFLKSILSLSQPVIKKKQNGSPDFFCPISLMSKHRR